VIKWAKVGVCVPFHEEEGVVFLEREKKLKGEKGDPPLHKERSTPHLIPLGEVPGLRFLSFGRNGQAGFPRTGPTTVKRRGDILLP